jgi:hypothetical protein
MATSVASAVFQPMGYQCCECSVSACGLPVLRVQYFSLWATSVAASAGCQPVGYQYVKQVKCSDLDDASGQTVTVLV